MFLDGFSPYPDMVSRAGKSSTISGPRSYVQSEDSKTELTHAFLAHVQSSRLFRTFLILYFPAFKGVLPRGYRDRLLIATLGLFPGVGKALEFILEATYQRDQTRIESQFNWVELEKRLSTDDE